MNLKAAQKKAGFLQEAGRGSENLLSKFNSCSFDGDGTSCFRDLDTYPHRILEAEGRTGEFCILICDQRSIRGPALKFGSSPIGGVSIELQNGIHPAVSI